MNLTTDPICRQNPMGIVATDPSERICLIIFVRTTLFGVANRVSYNVTLDSVHFRLSNLIGFQHRDLNVVP